MSRSWSFFSLCFSRQKFATFLFWMGYIFCCSVLDDVNIFVIHMWRRSTFGGLPHFKGVLIRLPHLDGLYIAGARRATLFNLFFEPGSLGRSCSLFLTTDYSLFSISSFIWRVCLVAQSPRLVLRCLSRATLSIEFMVVYNCICGEELLYQFCSFCLWFTLRLLVRKKALRTPICAYFDVR